MSPEDEKPTRHHHPMKIIAIIFLWILALYIAVSVLKNNEIESSTLESSRPYIQTAQKVCQSPECITLAHQLHNWQDISVDPCQDFYKAACGKFNEHSAGGQNRLTETTSIIKQLLKEHLIKNSSSTSKSENAMKLYYQKCEEIKLININETKRAIAEDIVQMVQKFGPSPLVDRNWNESNFNLNDLISRMASFGITNYGLFAIVPIDDSDLFVSFDVGILTLSDTYLKFRHDEKHILQDIFKTISSLIDHDMTNDDQLAIGKLARSLKNKSKPADIDEEKLGYFELQKSLPSVDFERIVKNLAHKNRKDEVWKKSIEKISATKDSFIFSNVSNLESVLKTTPKRTIANFVISNFIMAAIVAAVDEFEFQKNEGCLIDVVKKFPLASVRVIARNHFDKENLDIASQMVEDIRRGFVETIHESTWLQNETKMKALKKVEKMRKVVGYPRELEVPGALDSFFDSLELSPNDSFFDLQIKINRFEMERSLDFLVSIFPMVSAARFFQANAHYYPNFNQLFLDVPFLDAPIFHSTYPSYARVASIGGVIGHEIGHGFDPNGRYFDENGKLYDWWTSADSAEYDKRAQCLIEQYNNHDDPDFGRNLNGSVTIGEMAADLIGVNLSWKTYKNLDLSRENGIIGFEDYNKDKLFFRITALNSCRARYNNTLADQLTKPHPTSSFRVNGIFSNIKSFAEAYNCPVGSPMNPEKKCELF